MKKLILKVDVHDDKDKRKALKTVSALSGIDSISMDMKDRKLTVIGTVDPISVVTKLRKFWGSTQIISVGPAVEPKKEEPKKEEPKKEEPKKEDGKETKKDEPKKEEGKKEEPKKEEGKKEEAAAQAPAKKAELPEPHQPVVGMIMPYHRPSYYPPMNMNTYYHQYQPHHHSIEENPNACVIS